MDDFNQRLYEAGIDPGLIDYNRRGFQRLRTHDKPGKKNAAVVVLDTRPLRVWFQNHATGITGVATEGGSRFFIKADLAKVHAAREAEQKQRRARQAEAATLAEQAWRESPPADPAHPYLLRKRVQPHGLRQSEDGYLLVPLRLSGLVWNLQTIAPDGEKRFLSGGRKTGCYFNIGPKPTGTILLAEGFATGASLYEALGLPVAVCFDCGNLLAVGQALRIKYPRAELLYAADNDVRTEGNPGRTHATHAAALTHGRVVLPEFGLVAVREPLTDWNDYASRYGLESVRACFGEAVRNVG